MKGGKHRTPPVEDRKIDVMELAVLYRPKEKNGPAKEEPRGVPVVLPR